MASTDEGRLVLAARSGDERAFGQLFDAWFDRVHDLSRRIVHDPGIAAEVAQDAFLKAWTKLDTLDDPDAFGGWLLRITRNGSLNRLEKERRSVATDDEVLTVARDKTVTGDDPFEKLDDAGRVALVWEAAAALGERDQSVLDLHLRHGLSPAELAEELGCTPNNAHQVLFTMRKRLGNAIRAIVLYRAGRPTCTALKVTLADAGVTRFDAATVKLIDRHTDVCDECAEARIERVAPAALFAAAPIVAAPLTLKAAAAKGLSDAGAPMAGSTSAAHAPGGGPADPSASRTHNLGEGSGPDASVGGSVGGSSPSTASTGTAASEGVVAGAAIGSTIAGHGDGDPPDTTVADEPPEPVDTSSTLGKRRAALVLAAVAVLVAAVVLWPREDDRLETVSAEPNPTTTAGRSTTEAGETTTTEDGSTTVLTMVPVPRSPDDGPAQGGSGGDGGAGSESTGAGGGGTGGGAAAGGGGTGGGAGAGSTGTGSTGSGGGGSGGGGSNTTTSIGTIPVVDTTTTAPPAPKPVVALFHSFVNPGSCGAKAHLTLNWSTGNATSATLQTGAFSPVSVAVNGSVAKLCLTKTDFNKAQFDVLPVVLVATGPGGSTSKTIQVQIPREPAPVL
jgi:RNA polymerase sigma factor (sigma-70 family)